MMGLLDADGRRLLVRAGGNEERRQPDPQIAAGAPCICRVPNQMPLDPRPRFAVSHYLIDATVYRKWFFPSSITLSGPSAR